MSILEQPHFHNEAVAIARLEAIIWPNGPVCPHCGGVDRITPVIGGRIGPALRRLQEAIHLQGRHRVRGQQGASPQVVPSGSPTCVEQRGSAAINCTARLA